MGKTLAFFPNFFAPGNAEITFWRQFAVVRLLLLCQTGVAEWTWGFGG
jgi:hypothetical protein